MRPGGEGIGGNRCTRDTNDAVGTPAWVGAGKDAAKSASEDGLRPRDREAGCACGPAARGATGRVLAYQDTDDRMAVKVH